VYRADTETNTAICERDDLIQLQGMLGSQTIAYEAPGAFSADPLRWLDVAVAVIGIIVFGPIMLLIALAVKCQDRGSVIFSHRRLGAGGKAFNCLKFRTMVPNAEERLQALLDSDPDARAEWAVDHKLRDDPRVTWLGRALRSSSLDELPQFFNVLRGDMSIVGPRPIVLSEVEKYGQAARVIQSVRPGLTGLWQVSGRNKLSYEQRVALDLVYLRKRSLGFNLWIMWKTIPAVLLRDGSY